MAIARQLYELQEIDLEIESDEQTLHRLTGQLGEKQALVEAQSKLDSTRKRLEELARQQRPAEAEIDDISAKIAAVEKDLYSGRINNPKELSNLKHEVDTLKTKHDSLENNVLEIMDQVESAEANVAALSSELNKLETEWHARQRRLSTDIEVVKSSLADLNHKRQLLSAEIEPQAVEVYDKLRRQKSQAVARIEQGICRGCRISLPYSELQRARGGNLVQCSSCGRILFLP